jgi:hypothetical protein
MHGKRRYVKSRRGGYRFGVRLLVPLLAAALVAPAAAQAELVAPGVAEGALGVARNGSPRVAWIDGRRLMVATRTSASAWRPTAVATLPSVDGRVAGVAGDAVLVEGRRAWIRLVVRSGSRWRILTVRNAPKRALLGVSGLAIDAAGRPAVAYALQEASENTSLHLVRMGTKGRLTSTRITTKGFPKSVFPPAATPVLLPDRTIRVVETFSQRGANAILWRREGKRWWGRVLHASALGSAALPVYAAAAADGVYLAWTIPYPTVGQSSLVLSSHVDRSRSTVLNPNAFAAGLVLGSAGPEVAANELVQGVVAGIVTGGAQAELDGRVLGYAATPSGGRQLLLARPEGLEWFELPAPPSIQIVVDAESWRVQGATGGTVTIYEERVGVPRRPVFEAPVAADGAFSFSLPIVPGGLYRAVWVDPATGVPYARLLRP